MRIRVFYVSLIAALWYWMDHRSPSCGVQCRTSSIVLQDVPHYYIWRVRARFVETKRARDPCLSLLGGWGPTSPTSASYAPFTGHTQSHCMSPYTFCPILCLDALKPSKCPPPRILTCCKRSISAHTPNLNLPSPPPLHSASNVQPGAHSLFYSHPHPCKPWKLREMPSEVILSPSSN